MTIAAAAPRLHALNRGFSWQDAPRAGMRRLSAEQVDQYNRDGFFLLQNAFSAAEISRVIAAIDPLEQAHEQFVREQGGRHRLTNSGVVTFTAHVVAKSPVLQDFARHPVLKDVCHDLLGNDVRLYWDQSVYKKTQKPQEFPWHQDNGYTFIEPQQYLTLWIPLIDVDLENGCPWIAPGMHRLGTLEHWLTDIGRVCFEHAPDAVAVPAKAGDIVVFSSLAPHRTGPNLKDTVRKAYILQYAPDGAVIPLPEGGIKQQDDPHRQFKILDNGR